jgi:hypothetical protein
MPTTSSNFTRALTWDDDFILMRHKMWQRICAKKDRAVTGANAAAPRCRWKTLHMDRAVGRFRRANPTPLLQNSALHTRFA